MTLKNGGFTGELSKAEIEEACKAHLAMVSSEDWRFWDGKALSGVEFVSCAPGRVEYKFTVTEGLCNMTGNMHGGCAATILDNLTTMAGLTVQKQGLLDSGTVSRTLSCTYLRGLALGEKCTVVAEIVRAGKRLVNFRGEIRGEDGKPAVVCTHDKAVNARL